MGQEHPIPFYLEPSEQQLWLLTQPSIPPHPLGRALSEHGRYVQWCCLEKQQNSSRRVLLWVTLGRKHDSSPKTPQTGIISSCWRGTQPSTWRGFGWGYKMFLCILHFSFCFASLKKKHFSPIKNKDVNPFLIRVGFCSYSARTAFANWFSCNSRNLSSP